MMCPVCGKFEFTELQETDLLFRDEMQCSICGWKYDQRQHEDHDLKNGLNELSLNEYQAWYKQKIKENPDFDFQDENYQAAAHMCPVCHHYQFEDENSFDVCPFCGWCDDALMENEPDKWADNANDLCLNEFRERYQKFCLANPKYRFEKNGFSLNF